MATAKIKWEAAAKKRLEKVPFFVRPMVKSKVEQAAKEQGLKSIPESLIDDVKSGSHKG